MSNTTSEVNSQNKILNDKVELLLNKTLKNEELNTRNLNLKRDYKLTSKTNFGLWLDYLKSKLTNHDLIELIRENYPNVDTVTDSVI